MNIVKYGCYKKSILVSGVFLENFSHFVIYYATLLYFSKNLHFTIMSDGGINLKINFKWRKRIEGWGTRLGRSVTENCHQEATHQKFLSWQWSPLSLGFTLAGKTSAVPRAWSLMNNWKMKQWLQENGQDKSNVTIIWQVKGLVILNGLGIQFSLQFPFFFSSNKQLSSTY